MKPRIISGTSKNTLLQVADDITRPMTDRVKSALFSVINERISNSEILDLFAGSGALGLECLSRGARRAVFVELNPDAYKIVKENVIKTNFIEQAETYMKDANQYLNQTDELFDIIFICPPHKDVSEKYILYCANHLKKNGIIIAEHPKKILFPQTIGKLRLTETRTYGITSISFYTH